MAQVRNFLRDESGATAIEYGLIAGLISVIIIAVLTNVGTKLNAKFTRLSNALIRRAGAVVQQHRPSPMRHHVDADPLPPAYPDHDQQEAQNGYHHGYSFDLHRDTPDPPVPQLRTAA